MIATAEFLEVLTALTGNSMPSQHLDFHICRSGRREVNDRLGEEMGCGTSSGSQVLDCCGNEIDSQPDERPVVVRGIRVVRRCGEWDVASIDSSAIVEKAAFDRPFGCDRLDRVEAIIDGSCVDHSGTVSVNHARLIGAGPPATSLHPSKGIEFFGGGKGEMVATRIPVADGVFTWPSDEPRLLGSRCTKCANHMFPVQSSCPKCTSDSTETVELARRGTLWTWTVQGFPPKSPPYAGDADPKTFVPFGVGYVELPGQVKVEARLTESDPEKLHIGMELEMVIIPLHVDEAGQEVVTFAFAPVIENGGEQ